MKRYWLAFETFPWERPRERSAVLYASSSPHKKIGTMSTKALAIAIASLAQIPDWARVMCIWKGAFCFGRSGTGEATCPAVSRRLIRTPRSHLRLRIALQSISTTKNDFGLRPACSDGGLRGGRDLTVKFSTNSNHSFLERRLLAFAKCTHWMRADGQCTFPSKYASQDALGLKDFVGLCIFAKDRVRESFALG